MAYITNGGAKLIQRAVQEEKALVFGSVRMNSIYESNPSELVQKSDSWFGANVGEVVGCLSHVSVDDVSCVRDSKLAIKCNDNSKPWKSVGIYAHLEDEDDERLFACESIQNGDYKNVTIVELPVTLDGAVEDFGLSEGGGGGGGGDVPANMMTTDTEQTGLSGMKSWGLDAYEGEGSEDNPQDGDRKFHTSLNLGETVQSPISIETQEHAYTDKDGWMDSDNASLQLNAFGVTMNGSFASWGRVINAAKNEQGFDSFLVTEGGGVVYIETEQVKPNSEIKVGSYAELVIDSNGKIASVRAALGSVLDISAAVYDNGSASRVSGIVSTDGLSFDSPITPADGQTIFIHWTRYE